MVSYRFRVYSWDRTLSVLILVVVDDGLVLFHNDLRYMKRDKVLILVVVDDGLVLLSTILVKK